MKQLFKMLLLIRVKNKSSGKIVFARVVKKNLVQVDP